MSKAIEVVNSHDLDKKRFGFWVYVMTDCILFASLFATYAVLHNNTANGPSALQLFDLKYIFIETLILLTSSYTIGLALLAARRKDSKQLLIWLAVTFMLGLTFVGMEVYEFNHLISEGHSWTTSAFLSSYFTLVGTHGIHIIVGLLWMSVLGIQIFKSKLSDKKINNLSMLGIFWHFLDVVWIFIFSFVYLMGVSS